MSLKLFHYYILVSPSDIPLAETISFLTDLSIFVQLVSFREVLCILPPSSFSMIKEGVITILSKNNRNS